MDIDHRSGGLGGRSGRGIILLGDGSGGFGIHDSNEQDTDMFDNYEEDQDLESQVTKGTPSGSEDEGDAAEERSRREETPAPQTSSTDTLPSKTHSDASTTATKPIEKSEAPKVDEVTPSKVAS
jgi:protein phosphatase 2C family protein 2/3